jgi:hypothetical protein
MKKPVMAAIFSGLLLAGCGDTGGGAAESNSQPRVKLKNKHHEDLVALPDNLRRIGLMRAIRATGNRCPFRVESAHHQGEYRDLSYWTARCDDNRQWAVFVSASGHWQVRNCEDMAELELPRCAELPPAPPQPPRKVRRPGVTTDR